MWVVRRVERVFERATAVLGRVWVWRGWRAVRRVVRSVESGDDEEMRGLVDLEGEAEVAARGSRESRSCWMCLESNGARMWRLSLKASTSGPMRTWASWLRFILGASVR